ncbi:transcriptional regulator [Snodgrassella communis]|uniref:Transcriptional regulator, LysR family n=1 Tax=Snodgrassella communis TaxID=2946699 RepID=A0A066TU33_9NEIS|nr:LysR family transcriptional regulator [Snodgrassella communis]KDN12646.1 Transcriptional regulator, LysR family [Snodgrassella communis]KDN15404.1 Transcriptional regulator, LysR family [Snodgrassella communis]PIT09412.1 transcriptional regulator [Snodgrassella communis]PIT26469.1 transcriptional regulator [Snodgrassella communis]PIT28615.1 transcriptional regulator [Snodgrassella communis]
MDTLQSMWVFRNVVELGSFTRAAEFMDISTAMASKHLHHLEKSIQAKLLNRTSRRISLTEAGQEYYHRCVEALDTLSEAKHIAQAGTVKPQGLLKITAPNWCASRHFGELIAEYRQQYPNVTLSVYLDSQRTDLVAEGLDLALRVTINPEPNLIVKPITKINFLWVASPQYLHQHGIPHTLADLKQHYGLLPQYVHLDLPLIPVCTSNSTLLLHQMALNHMGLAYLPEWMIKEDIEHQRLQTINHIAHRENPTLYAAYMNREFLSAKVRSFIDFLAMKFATDKTG